MRRRNNSAPAVKASSLNTMVTMGALAISLASVEAAEAVASRLEITGHHQREKRKLAFGSDLDRMCSKHKPHILG